MKAYSIVGENRVEATPVQGILPIESQDEGDYRMYRITLPFLPPSKNVYDGWDKLWKSSAKNKWKRHIDKHVKALGIPKADRIGLAAILVFPTNARRDWQNYSQCLWNWVPDALQESGVIDGDHAGKIDFPPNLGVKFAVDKRAAPKEKRQRTIIVITMKVAKGA
ncbi:RusA-like Holliday junction resolvase [Arthrobacter phage KellEzio]|uniref:RusA-like resolvase n=1 Tax=Arthrobacter phage KellEzio TaxID=1796995 RepID=A0A140G690_9CAUD|nr:RusA-like Holliday junction resolvase [Arthrobacter phage KellEzio]AMM44175.1 RusA-like resolvase [Arthrobacter phage KellEzio]